MTATKANVPTKTKVRRLPDYITEFKNDTGVLPTHWISAHETVNPPAEGSIDSSVENQMANGKSVTVPNEGMEWKGDRWRQQDVNTDQFYEMQTAQNVDTSTWWLCFSVNHDDTQRVINAGAFNSGSDAWIALRSRNEGDDTRIVVVDNNGNKQSGQVANFDDLKSGRLLLILRIDRTSSIKAWTRKSDETGGSNDFGTLPASIDLATDARLGDRGDGASASNLNKDEYFEFGACDKAAASDSYVTNTLIPSLENKYF